VVLDFHKEPLVLVLKNKLGQLYFQFPFEKKKQNPSPVVVQVLKISPCSGLVRSNLDQHWCQLTSNWPLVLVPFFQKSQIWFRFGSGSFKA
jgi:hypothetical protein